MERDILHSWGIKELIYIFSRPKERLCVKRSLKIPKGYESSLTTVGRLFQGKGLYPVVGNLSPISTIRRSLGKISYMARYVHTFCWWFFNLNHVRYLNG